MSVPKNTHLNSQIKITLNITFLTSPSQKNVAPIQQLK